MIGAVVRSLMFSLVSVALGGAVAGIVMSGVGSERRELLVDASHSTGFGTWWAVGAGEFLLLLHGWIAVMYARAFSFELRAGRVLWLWLGALVLGFVAGSLLIYLWMFGVEVGLSNTHYGTEPGTPWNATQWAAYWAPGILQVLLAAVGSVALIVGIRAMSSRMPFLRVLGRYPKQGVQFPARIVSATAAPGDPESTHIVAEFAAPDGVRIAESVVIGTQREWLTKVKKAIVWLDPQQPSNPSLAAVRATSFWRGGTFPVSALPAASGRPTHAPGGLPPTP